MDAQAAPCATGGAPMPRAAARSRPVHHVIATSGSVTNGTCASSCTHQRALKAGGLPVVVLDPGHGGKDPGTIGVSGTYEKRVVLATAHELRKRLEAKGLCRVVMTRSNDTFIPLAEQTGLIVPLGRWVLREACEAAFQWPAALVVSVNLSPAQFAGSDVVRDVRDVLVQTRLPAQRLAGHLGPPATTMVL